MRYFSIESTLFYILSYIELVFRNLPQKTTYRQSIQLLLQHYSMLNSFYPILRKYDEFNLVTKEIVFTASAGNVFLCALVIPVCVLFENFCLLKFFFLCKFSIHTFFSSFKLKN